MNVEEFIREIEDNHLEHDLNTLSAKDRIAVYLNAKEFLQAKMQRSSAAPLGDLDTQFTVEHVENRDAPADD